jgi:hypothetical protein
MTPREQIDPADPFGRGAKIAAERQTAQAELDALGIKIESKPYEAKGGKSNLYYPIFARLEVGQCIACDAKDCRKLTIAMRKWAKTAHPRAAIKSNPKCADGKARIWLLQ